MHNTSIVTGTVPEARKHSILVPVHKSDDEDRAGNYRPKPLLSTPSKVLEKVIAEQLSEHLNCLLILSNAQHGFRSAISTNTALLTLTNNLYNNMDKKKLSLSLVSLCDLSKAPDSVNHEISIEKCAALNTDSFWFQNDLRNNTISTHWETFFDKT